MGYHDAQQVCMNGHQITDNYHRSPEFRRSFCDQCGAQTIHQCPKCGADIKGDYHAEGVVAIGFTTPVPEFCDKCGSKFPWAGKRKNAKSRKTLRDDRLPSAAARVDLVHRPCDRLAWEHNSKSIRLSTIN